MYNHQIKIEKKKFPTLLGIQKCRALKIKLTVPNFTKSNSLIYLFLKKKQERKKKSIDDCGLACLNVKLQ